MPTRSPIIHSDDHLRDPHMQHFSHMRMDSILRTPDQHPIKVSKQGFPDSPVPAAGSKTLNQGGSIFARIKKNHPLQNKRSHSNFDTNQHSSKSRIPYLAQNPNHFPAPKPPTLSQSRDVQSYNRPAEFDFDAVTDTLDLPRQRDFSKDGDEKTQYELMPFVRDRIYSQSHASKYTLVLTVLSLTILVLLTSTLLGFDPIATSRSFFNNKEVAQAQQNTPDPAYKKWANSIDFGSNVNTETKNADPDSDGLTNYEEYLLQSNPLQAKSCENITSDSAGLVDFINPGRCREVDWSNSSEVQDFISVFVSKKEYSTFINLYNTEITTAPTLAQNKAPALTSSTTVTIEKIQKYIEKHNSQSRLDPQLILDLSNKHSLKPELLLSLVQYGSNFGASYDGPNNLTNIGTTSLGAYSFKTDVASLESTAQLIHYLNIRAIPDCTQITIMYGGNLDACSQIQTIYNQIQL